jgi:hypothetical protein
LTIEGAICVNDEMKQHSQRRRPSSVRSKDRIRALTAPHLADIRGGLDIAVDQVNPPPSFMQQQHNETLIQL